MEITTLCAVVAALRVLPNRSQFFQYESVTLSCGQQGNSSDWRVMRNTSKNTNQECFTVLDKVYKSHCYIDDLYPADTGVYWCESTAGERCDTVSITVTRDFVILQSPALPVMEGDNVTLSCRERTNSSSSLTADFYKDGLLIGSSSTGSMTLHRVSQSDEGVYKCNISGAGESVESWLTVRAAHLELPNITLTHILLPVVVVCLSLVAVMLLCFWRIYKGKVSADVPYTDVTITQEVQPKRIRDIDAEPTFYSTVKPGDT